MATPLGLVALVDIHTRICSTQAWLHHWASSLFCLCCSASRNSRVSHHTRKHGRSTRPRRAGPLPLGVVCAALLLVTDVSHIIQPSRNRRVAHHTVVSTLRQTLEHASVLSFTHFFCPPTRTDARRPRPPPPPPPRRQQRRPSLYRCNVRRHPRVSPHASHYMSYSNGGVSYHTATGASHITRYIACSDGGVSCLTSHGHWGA